MCAADFMTQIDDLLDNAKSTDDKHILDKISKRLKIYYQQFRKLRKEDLKMVK